MTKELKALERIGNYQVVTDYEKDEVKTIKELLPNSYEVVETALKRLENHEQNEDFNKDVLNYAFLNEQDKIKKLKALEIIKEIDKNALLQFISVCVKDQDKYDLLKEALL